MGFSARSLLSTLGAIAVLLPASSASFGQPAGPDLPDAPAPAAAMPQPPSDASRTITFRSLPADFLHDQKEIWFVFPGQVAHGHHWLPLVGVTALTAGLIVSDRHAMPYFRSHQGQWDDLNDTFGSKIAAAEIAAVPLSLLTTGFLRHDSDTVDTALLATDAYADSAVVQVVMKAIARRERPSAVAVPHDFTGTFFSSNGSPFSSSFPSGHATAAFSIATVVARRYRDHRWVPWAVYGMATAISLSRVTQLAHYPSDIFVGAALGYSVARYQVLRPQ